MRPKLSTLDEDFLLESLSPRQICLLLAVCRGRKPITWIESVETGAWDRFLGLVSGMNLCCSYETPKGRVFVQPATPAEAHDTPERLTFVPERQWNDALREGVTCDFACLDPRSPLAKPTVSLGSCTQAYVARTVEELVYAMRMRETDDIAGMGRAFGYPECCVAEYRRVGGGAEARNEFNKKLLEKGLDQAMPPEMWATYHVPCSPECRASARLAASYLGAVRSFSPRLLDRVMAGLRLSRLSYSTSERFVDMREIRDDAVPGQASRRSIMRKVRRFIKEPEEIIAAITTRPLSYANWEEPPYRVRLLPGNEGPKWIAYHTGRGALVMDAGTLEVDIFVDVEALPSEQRPNAETAFHVFRCRTSDHGG